ncbi:subtilisin-like protein [Peniophora sp. CONT]|nr:subtilisin-like protein [Peniophora sp. CONT]
MLFRLFPALAWASLASASTTHLLKERVAPPRNWNRLDAAPRDHVIPLKFALPQPRFDELEDHLLAVSDPEHSRYGAHLSKEEVDELVRPEQESIDVVDAWLKELGFGEEDVTRSSAMDWVMIMVPVGMAEDMLDTTFHTWQHTESGHVTVRTTSYSLPKRVHQHIDLVYPTTYFSNTRALRSTVQTFKAPESMQANHKLSSQRLSVSGSNSSSNGTVDPSCGQMITPDCLLDLYNARGYNASAESNNSIGVTGFIGQNAVFEDVQSFYADFVPEASNSSFDVVLVNGGENSQNISEAGQEADLDVQYAFGLTYPTPGAYWSVGGSPPFQPDTNTPENRNEPYADWLDYILAQDEIPQTISSSYADDEQTVPQAYAQLVCSKFAQLGARGVSVLVASGDQGTGDGNPDPETSDLCIANDGTNRTKFLPMFPASCPYVTAVGGTWQIPEIAANFSSGGFSQYFPTPKYQKSVVSSYLSSHVPESYISSGLLNASGRAFPDVSAQSVNYMSYFGGDLSTNTGTSAAAPAFAAIISLLNDARLRAGRPSLGFLNPLLYSKKVSAALNDITEGENLGCGTRGFNATKGWDPVTGLGTPDFWKLKPAVAP